MRATSRLFIFASIVIVWNASKVLAVQVMPSRLEVSSDNTLYYLYNGNLLRLDDATWHVSTLEQQCFDFSLDKSDQTVMFTQNVAQTGVTLNIISSQGTVQASGLLRLQLDKLFWSGLRGRFLSTGRSPMFAAGDIPYSAAISLQYDAASHRITAGTIPGMSDAVSFCGGGFLVDSWHPGTFAYSALITAPEVTLHEFGPPQAPSPSYLVVAKDWRRWKVWQTASMPSSTPIDFSADGNLLLCRLSGAQQDKRVHHEIVDLTTGKSRQADWLSTDLEMVGLGPSLNCAIVLIQRPATMNEFWQFTDEYQQILTRLSPKGQFTADGKEQWLLVKIDDQQKCSVLKTFNSRPTLASTKSGDAVYIGITGDSILKVTDAGQVLEHTIVAVTPSK
jgi:hypothetical protein